MPGSSYLDKRHQLQDYFDRTAVAAWERLTSDAPVSGIRRKVRAGRDGMRTTLLGWLPDDLHGRRVLDAGCGTGALAIEAARRGADVVGIDISPNLIEVARQRTPAELRTRLHFEAGDMLAGSHGRFDHIVAMDSLIHYLPDDMLVAVAGLQRQLRECPPGFAPGSNDDYRTPAAAASRPSLLFTFAPRTPLLMALYHVGKLFPRADRSPAIEPVAESLVRQRLAEHPDLTGLRAARSRRIDASFYKSQALELVRQVDTRHAPAHRQTAATLRTSRVAPTGEAANA